VVRRFFLFFFWVAGYFSLPILTLSTVQIFFLLTSIHIVASFGLDSYKNLQQLIFFSTEKEI